MVQLRSYVAMIPPQCQCGVGDVPRTRLDGNVAARVNMPYIRAGVKVIAAKLIRQEPRPTEHDGTISSGGVRSRSGAGV